MLSSVLLCAAVLAAENPAQLRARVLRGGGPREEQAATELWICHAMAQAGSAGAQPLGAWVGLTGGEQRLYASPEGGCIIDGHVSLHEGRFKVEISGCEGVPLAATALLGPGERRVVRLSANRPPNNLFLAIEATASKQTQERARIMRAHAGSFRLEVNYHGAEDKPFYRLLVSVPPLGEDGGNPFHRVVPIAEEQAAAVIDFLAREGFFDQARSVRERKLPFVPAVQGYTLRASAGDEDWLLDLGWGLPMIQWLERLREALPAAARHDMGFLLARLSGLRGQWQAAQAALEAEADRGESQVEFYGEGEATIIDIHSDLGVGSSIIHRTAGEWPRPIRVRLRLRGLESFKAGGEELSVEWSVAGGGEQGTRVSLWKQGEEQPLSGESPFHTQVRLAGGNAVPLQQGFFEVPLPAALFEGNPAAIGLSWVDFFRQ